MDNKIMIISTPEGDNFFMREYQRHLANERNNRVVVLRGRCDFSARTRQAIINMILAAEKEMFNESILEAATTGKAMTRLFENDGSIESETLTLEDLEKMKDILDEQDQKIPEPTQLPYRDEPAEPDEPHQDCEIYENHSWQKMNKGKLSKKARRKQF